MSGRWPHLSLLFLVPSLALVSLVLQLPSTPLTFRSQRLDLRLSLFSFPTLRLTSVHVANFAFSELDIGFLPSTSPVVLGPAVSLISVAPDALQLSSPVSTSSLLVPEHGLQHFIARSCRAPCSWRCPTLSPSLMRARLYRFGQPITLARLCAVIWHCLALAHLIGEFVYRCLEV